MKRIALVLALALLLAGCAVPTGAHDAGGRGDDATVFVEDHRLTKDAAFLAAAGWFSEHYKGGRDAVQLSDRESGTIAAKGAYRWSKPTDPFALHFHEGWAEYTLKVKITDTKVEMEIKTGEVYGEGDHGLNDLMPQLLPYYQSLRTGLMKALSGK